MTEMDKLMSQEQMDAMVKMVWERSQTEILKQVEYAISNEMSTRARARAHTLIIREVDAILKPKIAAMKEAMETRATLVVSTILVKLEAALKSSLEEAIRYNSEYTVRHMLAESERRVQGAMMKALNQKED